MKRTLPAMLPWVVVAAVMTALTAIKPLHIDDTYYYYLARQIVAHPLDPYGFFGYWGQWPMVAIELLSPALLSYWLAIPIGLFGDNPMAWKVFLFPVALVLLLAARNLGDRFAGGRGVWVALAIAFSPAVLPAFNMMLDVPQLAFALAALATMVRAVECGGRLTAVLAGLLAGVACQLKYNGLLVPPLLFAYALLFGRPLLGLLAATTAFGLFVSWEALLHLKYGTSHFLHALLDAARDPSPGWENRSRIYVALLGNLGYLSAIPAVALLGVFWRRGGAKTGAIVAGAFAMLGIAAWVLPLFGPYEQSLALGLGAVVVIAVLAALGFLIRDVVDARHRLFSADGTHGRLSLFLIIWFVLEFVAHVYLSPFGAVRRALVLYVLTVIIFFRVGMRGVPVGEGRWAAGAVVVAIALTGFWVYYIDWHEADTSRRAADEAAAVIRNHDPQARIWYVGHWGFAYYADRQGMRPLVPDYSRLNAGDWVVVPQGVDQQAFVISPDSFELVAERSFDDRWAIRTVPDYYVGVVPLSHNDAPRMLVGILRARQSVVPRSPFGLEYMLRWMRSRPRVQSAVAGMPALMRWWDVVGDRDRLRILDVIELMGPRSTGVVPQLVARYDGERPAVRQRIVSVVQAVVPASDVAQGLAAKLSQDREVARSEGQALR